MNTYNKQTDPLNQLFRKLPEEQLPDSFRSHMMEQIIKESIKAKKRNERMSLLAAILASLVMIALGVISFIYMEIPKISIAFSKPDYSSFSSFSLYIYIGILALLLLFADYKMRQAYKKKHKE